MRYGGREGWERGAKLCRGVAASQVEWAHDSAWRFLPTVKHDLAGFQLHPIDLAINKLLELKREWLTALDGAEAFVHSRPPSELGCLYYSPLRGRAGDGPGACGAARRRTRVN